MSKFIASGTYGCVIKPSLNCKDNDNKIKNETVAKLFSSKSEWEYEIKENNLISDIDKDHKFTVEMLNSCPISIDYINNNVANINNCSIINNKQEIYQIIYKDGGNNLRNLFTNPQDLNINDFLKKFGIIFDGLYEINMKGLCHRDIKLENLLFDGNKVTLIDFGLMEEKTKLYTYNNLLLYVNNDIYYYPSEMRLYAALKLNKSIDVNKLNSIKFVNFLENYSIQKSDYSEIIKNMLNKMKEDTYKFADEIKKIKSLDEIKFQNIDVYLLGIALFEIVFSLIINNLLTDLKKELLELIERMIEINPYNRITIKEAKDIYKDIYKDLYK